MTWMVCKKHSWELMCPTGEHSWCRQNAAVARGDPEPSHRYHIPQDVAKALLPIYNPLAENSLLERCQRGKTQNSNECPHSTIWNFISKEQHSSLFSVQAGVAEAVLRFNTGNEYAVTTIFGELNLNATISGSQRAKERDLCCSTSSSKKRALTLVLQNLTKKKHQPRTHPDYAPGVFV